MGLIRTVEQIRELYMENSDCYDASSYEVQDLCEEIFRLRATLDKLPKCWRLNDANVLVQDVPVVPGMQVWRNRWRDRWPTTLGEKVRMVNGTGGVWLYGIGPMYSADQLSSSYEAAEAAGEE